MKKLIKSHLCHLALTALVAFMTAVTAFGQNRTVTGSVVDAQGTPVIGASVIVVGNTTIGTINGIGMSECCARFLDASGKPITNYTITLE